ncbi:MAG: hypothetical protein CAPSK01_000454 [Candidatus Accumulibacter vicinus]|uniref:Uncharacterized protein n=1 Tax=Candidatus Accumulibacter vicinus TaxID=2954382 RepID=A0A084Y5R1_9PROT|nr:MAG: hypothetical protein CAPSK01_000454 [Candidatus Accumulibacter vicinus]
MADQDGLFDSGGIKQLRQPVGEGLDAAQGRSAGEAVPRQVGNENRATGSGQTAGDLQPGIAIIGGPVDQQQRRPARARRVESPAASAQAAAVASDGQLHTCLVSMADRWIRLGLPARSGAREARCDP